MTLSAIPTVPNRPLGTQPRSIADILGDFDHITNYINNSIVPEVNNPRLEFSDILQQGVVSGGGGNRDSATQVTIAAGVGYITQVDGSRKRVTWSSTSIAAIPAGVANGRVDQFVVDSAGIVSRLAGTNAGAAIANLDDANATASRAAVPAQSMRLFEVVVDNTGVTSTAGTKVRDRRQWARGVDYHAFPGGLTVPQVLGPLSIPLIRRVEVAAGNDLELFFSGAQSFVAAQYDTQLLPYVNSVNLGGIAFDVRMNNVADRSERGVRLIIPTASLNAGAGGSFLLEWRGVNNSGVGASSISAVSWGIIEKFPNRDNGTA